MNWVHTSGKLAGLYLAILMVISLFFSFNLYQLSVQEFDRGFRGQGTILRRRLDSIDAPITHKQLLQEQQDRYEEAKSRVLDRLIFVNVAILVGGGFLSYYLARRTLKPIEEAHAELERFTADASHELRTPIAAMQTETEVALMNPKLTLAQAKAQLKSNLEELAKLTSLSESLLRLAKAENTNLQRQNMSLETIVLDAINRAAPAAAKKHITIPNKIDKTIIVLAEASSLTEAIVILLDNAIKYSPEKSEVTVEAYKEQNHAVIKVEDNGAGIKATELPHIYDRFYRADSSRSKHHTGGYGLGLAIAKNIIELHGGSITVKSSPGVGSVFTIHIPLA